MDAVTESTEQKIFDADYLLSRYGAWSMDRFKKSHCASIEHRYRPPLTGETEEDRRRPRLELMPTFDAMAVHRAVIRVPQPFRAVLFAYYVRTRRPIVAVKCSLGMSWEQFEAARVRGLMMFTNLYPVKK